MHRPSASVLSLLLSAVAAIAQAPVRYELAFPNRAQHEAEIVATFSEVGAAPLVVRMSRSSPGRYALHEFAKNVYRVRVRDGRGRDLPFRRRDPHSWEVSEHDGTVQFAYTLFGRQGDGTYAAIDRRRAHLNAPASFVWADGQEQRPIELRIQRPDPDWIAASQLVPTDDPDRFTAPDLYYFLDSPLRIGPSDERSWQIGEGEDAQTIRLSVIHVADEDAMNRFAEGVRVISEETVAAFGEAPRFDYGVYTYICEYTPWASGDGMEHRNSTICTSTRGLAGNGAVRNLGTIAHEFVHAWNVERIRPRDLEPFDFTRANMSAALWFGEGFTSYYGSLIMLRAGYTEFDSWARRLAGGLQSVVAGPAREFRSAVGMSQQAPFVDGGTSSDPTNRRNTNVSYYTYGSVLALGLDLTLRSRFDRTLDDYMAAVWREHGAPGKPFELVDLERILGELVGDPAFGRDWFARYVHGREAMDYAALLDHAGIELFDNDAGKATLGTGRMEYSEDGARLRRDPAYGTPAYLAGLNADSMILELDGRVPDSAEVMESIRSAHQIGDEVPIRYRAQGVEVRGRIRFGERQSLRCRSYEEADRKPSADQLAFRRAWISSKRS